jgi:hypothetical protein
LVSVRNTGAPKRSPDSGQGKPRTRRVFGVARVVPWLARAHKVDGMPALAQSGRKAFDGQRDPVDLGGYVSVTMAVAHAAQAAGGR